MANPAHPEGDESLPDNVIPIRQEMMFLFNQNTPIVDPQLQEAVECRRYEQGLCRECDVVRGHHTPWCLEHYPWNKGDWRPRE